LIFLDLCGTFYQGKVPSKLLAMTSKFMYNVLVMKDFVGNTVAIKYIESAVSTGNVSHAYLFCGPANVGKTTAAQHMAKLLLCEGDNPLSCDACESCKLMAAGNHPDFFFLDTEAVLVADIRELVGSLDLKPYRGQGKVALVTHAEKLTNQALNAFLKTLEEPSDKTTIILTAENSRNLLPTIVSRARMVNFSLVAERPIFEYINGELGIKKDIAKTMSTLAAGRVGAAVHMAEDPEKPAEMQRLAADFSRIYKSQDIYEKISYADILVKDKEALGGKLQDIELAVRAEMVATAPNISNKAKIGEFTAMLDKLMISREMIAKNANAKLVVEGLLLGSI
jgi:DNA polymerase III delta' subunit